MSIPGVPLRCVLHCKRSPSCPLVAWRSSPSDCLTYASLASGLPPVLSSYDVYVAVRDDRLFVLPNLVLWDAAERLCDDHAARLFPLTDAVAGAAVLAEGSLSVVHIGLRKVGRGWGRGAVGRGRGGVGVSSIVTCRGRRCARADGSLSCCKLISRLSS